MAMRLCRADQTAETRRRLLDAARSVFVARGFFDATLDQVADAAGLTKGAVYSRFTNKGDLFLALYEQLVDERFASIRDAVDATKRLEDTAAVFVRRWMALVRADRAWSQLIVEFRVYAARRPDLNARYAALQGRLREAFAAGLAERFAAAGLVPQLAPADAARTMLALLSGTVLARMAEGDAFGDALMERVATAFMRDLITTARPVRAARRAAPRPRRTARKERTP